MKNTIEQIIDRIVSLPMTDATVFREIQYNDYNNPYELTRVVHDWRSATNPNENIKAVVVFYNGNPCTVTVSKSGAKSSAPFSINIDVPKFVNSAGQDKIDEMYDYCKTFNVVDSYTSFL